MAKLNYILEIKAFYDWMGSNRLTPAAIALWHALMDIANRSYWPDDLTPTMSTLQSRMGCGKDTVHTARNLLKQKGRIDFRERRGNQSTVYRLLPFVAGFSTQNQFASGFPPQAPPQTTAQTPLQAPLQTTSIYKQSYKKQNIFPAQSLHTASDGLAVIFQNIQLLEHGMWVEPLEAAITLMYTAPSIRVNRVSVPQAAVRQRLLMLDRPAVEQTLERLAGAGEAEAPLAYLAACLYNAPMDLGAAIALDIARTMG